MSRDVATEIHRLSARRTVLWAQGDGEGSAELSSIAAKLTALYEEKRIAVAKHGTAKQRDRAVKRADAEKEIDRLMGVS